MSWHFSLQNNDLWRPLEKEAKSNTKKIQVTRKMLVCTATQMTDSIKHLQLYDSTVTAISCDTAMSFFSSEKLTLSIQDRWFWVREAAPSLTKHWLVTSPWKKHVNLLPGITRVAFYIFTFHHCTSYLPHLQLTASLQDRTSCKYWLGICIPTGDWQLSVIAGSRWARGVSLVPNSRQNKTKNNATSMYCSTWSYTASMGPLHLCLGWN